MTRSNRFHIDELPDGEGTPKHLSKQQFGQRLYKMMVRNGWNQSELARQADLPRDSISTYIRGKSFPTPKSLGKLAQAFGVSAADILPNSLESAIDHDTPATEIRISVSSPNVAWVRVNRMMTVATATKIAQLLAEDTYSDETPDPA